MLVLVLGVSILVMGEFIEMNRVSMVKVLCGF